MEKRDREIAQLYREGMMSHAEVMRRLKKKSNGAYIFLALKQKELYQEENLNEEE